MPVAHPALHYLEIVTPDVESACQFYREAFDWRFGAAEPALGLACVAELPDGSRCGIRAPLHEQEAPIVRPYLRVADLGAATREAAQLGASILLDGMDLPGWGRISIIEIGGVQQGLWEVPGTAAD